MFLTQTAKARRVVPPCGPRDARIAIVGEAPGAAEDLALKPFVGPAGSVLEQCMHAAGIVRGEVYLTNVVKVRPPNNDISPYYDSSQGTFSKEGMQWVESIREEIQGISAKVIVACGACAFSALAGGRRITKYRGYPFQPCFPVGRECVILPCIHPSAALRGMYIYRHLIAADLGKAKRLAALPSLLPPARKLIYEYSSVEEALEWLEYFQHQQVLGVDIEVIHYELSCISFSSDPNLACVIPIANRWTEQEEVQIWRGLQRTLGSNGIKVFQNGIFDVHFLLTRCGIVVKGAIHDTMIGHHIMYPELPKSLAFLGSLYCETQPYWKDKVQFDNIKDES